MAKAEGAVALLLLALLPLWVVPPPAIADIVAPAPTVSPSPSESPSESRAPDPSPSTAVADTTGGATTDVIVAATVVTIAALSWLGLRRISRRKESAP